MSKNRSPRPQSLRPGSPAPFSGIYQRPDGEQVVSTEGNPLPPTPKPGQTYRPVQPAHHKPSRPKR